MQPRLSYQELVELRLTYEERAIKRKLDDWGRIACPRGHCSLTAAKTTSTAYCQTCDASYGFEELVDKQKVPISERPWQGDESTE